MSSLDGKMHTLKRRGKQMAAIIYPCCCLGVFIFYISLVITESNHQSTEMDMFLCHRGKIPDYFLLILCIYKIGHVDKEDAI